MNKRNNKRGFVALTLVLTISSLLLAFSFSQSLDVGHFFDLTKNKEYRLINYYKAYNCIDQAILNLSHDYFYEVSTSTKISELGCSIDSVKNTNGTVDIIATGNYKDRVVRRKARVKVYDNKLDIIIIE